jgi:hypothetical protein
MASDRINSKNLGGTTKLSWYDAMGDKSTVDVMGRAIYENRKGEASIRTPMETIS